MSDGHLLNGQWKSQVFGDRNGGWFVPMPQPLANVLLHTFQDECRLRLKRHEVEFDERYVCH
jgi:hypothetical protein